MLFVNIWSYAINSNAPSGILIAVVVAADFILPPDIFILLLSNGNSMPAANAVAPVAQQILFIKGSFALVFVIS